MRRTLLTLTAIGVLFVAAACGQDDSQVAVGRDEASPAAERASSSRQAAQESSTTTSVPASTTSTITEDGSITAGANPTEPTTPSSACGGSAPAGASALRSRPADLPPECLPQPEPEPATRPDPEPVLQTGDVQATLRWDSSSDLDLHVTEPNSTEIWYQNRGPSSTGGQLDVDSNVGCDQGASVENIFWPTNQGPTGSYTVEVVGFQVDGCGSGDYTLTVMVRGEEVLSETGTVGEDETDTYHFDV